MKNMITNNWCQQHLRKHGADSDIRQARSSWLLLSLADRKVLRSAPRFLAAIRCAQPILIKFSVTFLGRHDKTTDYKKI
jgi:hypothetical protein